MGSNHYRMVLNLNEYHCGRIYAPNGCFWDWAMITTHKAGNWNGAHCGQNDSRPIECRFKDNESEEKVMGIVWSDTHNAWMAYGPHSEAFGHRDDNHHVIIPVAKRYSIKNHAAFGKAIKELFEMIK